jgi:hypothetical protein
MSIVAYIFGFCHLPTPFLISDYLEKHKRILSCRCEVQNGVGEIDKTIALDVQGTISIYCMHATNSPYLFSKHTCLTRLIKLVTVQYLLVHVSTNGKLTTCMVRCTV